MWNSLGDSQLSSFFVKSVAMRIKRVITILNDLGRVELEHGPHHGADYENAVRSHVTNEVGLYFLQIVFVLNQYPNELQTR